MEAVIYYGKALLFIMIIIAVIITIEDKHDKKVERQKRADWYMRNRFKIRKP